MISITLCFDLVSVTSLLIVLLLIFKVEHINLTEWCFDSFETTRFLSDDVITFSVQIWL